MSTSQYDIGSRVNIDLTFRTTAGTLTNPTKVHMVVTSPSDTDTVVNSTASGFTNSTAGKFRYALTATAPGRWRYQANSTGTLISAISGAFTVKPRLASTST